MKTNSLLLSVLLAGGMASAAPLQPGGIVPLRSLVSTHAAFQWIHAHRQGRDIAVSWIWNGASSPVTAYTVIKTYEDPADPYAVWTTVATVNNVTPRMYKVTDNSVLPGYSSYRVVATLADGSIEYSEVRTVRIVQH